MTFGALKHLGFVALSGLWRLGGCRLRGLQHSGSGQFQFVGSHTLRPVAGRDPPLEEPVDRVLTPEEALLSPQLGCCSRTPGARLRVAWSRRGPNGVLHPADVTVTGKRL